MLGSLGASQNPSCTILHKDMKTAEPANYPEAGCRFEVDLEVNSPNTEAHGTYVP